MNPRYKINNEGFVIGVSYDNDQSFPFEFTGEEPFAPDWEESFNYHYINNDWELIMPVEPARYIDIELIMPNRNGYERKCLINGIPIIDFKAGVATIEIQVKHYLNNNWVYNKNVRDKVTTLTADDETRIAIDNEGNTWGEFQYIKFLFENYQVYFFDEIINIVQNRIDDGTIDNKITY